MLLDQRKFLLALGKADDLVKSIGAGSSSREIGLVKIEALMELGRTEEAYNLSNAMVLHADSSSGLLTHRSPLCLSTCLCVR